MRTYLTTVIFADGRRKDRTRTVRATGRSDARAQARSHAKALWPNAKVAKVTAEHVSSRTIVSPTPVVSQAPAPIQAATDVSRKAAAQTAFKAIVSLQGGKAAARAYRSVMQADDPELESLAAIVVAELTTELAAVNG